uniref:Seven TM Receptor n=1 Tax=Caenorhabditis tropicalis TaxID=1561998 RepID=A0A1I7TC93_9PELO
MQLYKALVAQTVIPVLLLFMPFGLLFTLPIFEIDCQLLASLITLIFAIYPAVDPLPILYFIDYYRIPILEWFRRKKLKANQIQVSVIRDVSLTINSG